MLIADDKTTKTPEQPVTDSGPGEDRVELAQYIYESIVLSLQIGRASCRERV